MPKKTQNRSLVLSLIVPCLFAGLWTLLIGLALLWNRNHIRGAEEDLARVAARSSIEKDVLYRRWATMHGGVYVPVTDTTPPSPYLAQIPERDIFTPSGRALTVMNPAYMMRQVHELGEELYKDRGHITSLNPIRPENAPDPWERKALEAFDLGETEVSSFETINGEPYLRLMRPMVTEAGCLKCHAAQGYKEGDIRGGISVALNMKGRDAVVALYQRDAALTHGGIWALGLVFIGLGARQVQQRRRERERAAEAIQASAARLAEAQRIAHLGNWDWDIRANTLYWSDEIYRIFGLAPREFSATYDAFLARVHPDDRVAVEAAINTALRGEGSYGIDHRIILPDGTLRIVRERGEVFFDESGQPLRMLGTVQDVTEVKLRQQQLAEADKMASLGFLTSGVAHEINNPNHAIMADASLLLDAWNSAQPVLDQFYKEYGDFALAGSNYSENREQIREMFASVLASSKRIQVIVQELRDFARQSPADQMGEVDINIVVKSVSILVSNMVAKCTDHFHIHYGSDVPKITGNFQRIEQVVINLVQNASQALADRTKGISMTTAYVKESDAVVIEVSDEGVGINAENLKHIMDPFYTSKRDSGGMGLGLWISTNIVHEHGGTLEFSSMPGAGTKARIILPVTATRYAGVEQRPANTEKST